MDFIGPTPDSVSQKLSDLAAGFTAKKLSKEIYFTSHWDDGQSFDSVYYHTSTNKGFTHIETLKTFIASALRSASKTGHSKIAVILKGQHGEGLVEQLVEGALVGTWSFRDYKKESDDPFKDMELVLCLPAPPMVVPEVAAEVLAEEKAPSSSVTVAIDESELPEEVSEKTATEVAPAIDDAPETKEPEAAEGDAEPPEKEASDASEKAEDKPEADSDTEAEKDEKPEAEAIVEPEPEHEAAPEPEPEEEPEPVEPPAPVVDEEALARLMAGDAGGVQVGEAFADGVNLARSLVAMPASDCTPDYLARRCKKLASTHGFSYQAFGPKQLETHGYAGLVTVGKGADNSPRMIEMTYSPEQDAGVHLVLLGKGVTFDSGGISIKGANNMHLMVGDMAGAAAVIGAMEVLGRLKPAIKVTAIVVSAENKPGSKSYRPGDIIRYKNGTSVHVENTDAEGRLILADGLIRAGELGATHIVDLATLTGSCARALGPSFTGVMGANRKLVNAITRAGGNHGESYWRLPMPVEYRDMLKSVHADINNVGGPDAGATTAALFLKEFVPAGTPWVHLDIAGTFWKSKPWKYYCEGPSGTGVKTISDLALRWTEHLG